MCGVSATHSVIMSPGRASFVWAFLLACGSADDGLAIEESRQTVIEIKYDWQRDDVPPLTGSHHLHWSYVVTLSGSHDVHEVFTSTNRDYTGVSDTALGHSSTNKSWSVISSKRLRRVQDLPQNKVIFDVSVADGGNCVLQVTNILKRNFHDYTFITTNNMTHKDEVTHFRNLKVTGTTCSIR
jgi:hypothetical protein